MRKIRPEIFIFFIASVIISCSHELVPGFKKGKQGGEYDKAKYDYRYVEAIRLKLMGNYGEALKFFEMAVELNPKSDASYYQMAQIVLNNGDIQHGKEYIKKACSIDPKNYWYNMTLAGIYYQQKNLDSTIICYENAVKGNPDKIDLQIALANLYIENKNFEKSRTLLDWLDEKFGVNENTTLLLVKTLMAEKKYDDALLKIQKLIEQDPDNVLLNGYLAEIYREKGENQLAKGVYNKLIERNPGNPALQISLCDFLIEEKSFDQLFLLLNTVILNDSIKKEDKTALLAKLIDNNEILKNYGKEMELAVRILEAAYKDDDLIMLMRPDLLQKEHRSAEAAQRLEEIAKQFPNNYLAWEKLLLVYYDLKDYKKLQERGKECATKFNRSVLAKILYADGAMENKDFNTALEELRKADILAGDNKDMKLQVLTMRADVLYRMKDYQGAFSNFDEALKLNSNDLAVMNNYAYYLAEQDTRLRDAEKMAKAVIVKEKDNNTFLDTYAWVLYKRGKTREASKIMEKLATPDGKADAEYYEHYGFILRKEGRCNEAVRQWETALNLDKSKVQLLKEIKNCGK
ncbi:MAG: tetratricopeptide repeat protein [Bacteroidota bacterium]|nr:tetratricopeptide repeat protein [Bacteroidota bacterium]